MGRVVWGSLGQFGVVCIEEEYKIYMYILFQYICNETLSTKTCVFVLVTPTICAKILITN